MQHLISLGKAEESDKEFVLTICTDRAIILQDI